MKYDDASWHYASTPDGPEEERWNAAAAHIGAYLRCCFLKGWAGEFHQSDPDSAVALKSVLAGQMTGTQFLIDQCDCKFTNEDLTDEGNAFAAYYYKGDYFADVEPLIDGELLSSPEERYDIVALRAVFEKRYAQWIASGRPAKKRPWWKLW